MTKSKLFLLLLIALCLVVTALTRGRVTGLYEKWQMKKWDETAGEFQDSRAGTLGVIEFLGTGVKPLLADMYWIKATTLNADKVFEMRKLQRDGGPDLMQEAESEEGGRSLKTKNDLYDIITMVSFLDPEFEYAYYYGAHLLAWDDEMTLAMSLLDRGLRNNPDSAMLLSSMSFFNYYFLKDWETGAYYAEKSYEASGKYSATPKAVANLYAAGRDYDLAITFLSGIIETTTDPDTREQLEKQLKYIIVEKHIEFLEKALSRYRNRYGAYPADLEALVTGGVISELPADPFGGRFVITAPGTVENEPVMRLDHYSKMRRYQDNLPESGRQRL